MYIKRTRQDPFTTAVLYNSLTLFPLRLYCNVIIDDKASAYEIYCKGAEW